MTLIAFMVIMQRVFWADYARGLYATKTWGTGEKYNVVSNTRGFPCPRIFNPMHDIEMPMISEIS